MWTMCRRQASIHRFVVLALGLGVVCLVAIKLHATMLTRVGTGVDRRRIVKFVDPDGQVVDVPEYGRSTSDGRKAETDDKKSLRSGGREDEATAVKMVRSS